MPSPALLTRRKFLRATSNVGLGLATGALIRSSRAGVADAKTIKVGILHSLTGLLGPLETPLCDAELLAIEEINNAGGVLGKKVEAVVEDPESAFTDRFPTKAKKLLVEDKDCQFEVVYEAKTWLAPDPYPAPLKAPRE